MKDADALFSQFSVSKLITENAPSDVTIDRLIVSFPQYFANLSSIMSETRGETLQTFFVWKIVQSFVSIVDAEAITPLRRFNNELAGKVF